MAEIKREIVTGEELSSAIKRGVDKLSDTVKSTMGPKGRLVLIQRPGMHRPCAQAWNMVVFSVVSGGEL